MFRAILCLAAIMSLAGCQTYEPKPLRSDAHLAEWMSRSPDSKSVREYAASIGAEPVSSETVADGVSLAEAEIVALVFNPDLRAARARAAVALAGAENAGLWDDPSLSVDVLRVTESVPDPWVIGGILGFNIPLSGRLSVEKAAALAEHGVELARVAETEWGTVVELRSVWAQWSATRMQAELLGELLARVDQIVSIVDRLEAAASLSRLEGRLFRMERASRQSELLLLEAQSAQLELQIKSLMGLVPDAAVTLLPQIAGETEINSTGVEIEQRNPTLATQRAAYAAAEEALHLEILKQYPDLQIGPAYEWDEGQNKIGLGGGLILPMLNANRQGIAIARAERDAARIEYETTHERLVSAYQQAQRNLAATRAARESIETNLLPLAEAQIADERKLAELGELNVLLTLESVVRAHETKVQLIDARVAEAQAAFRMQELLGPAIKARAAEEQP